MIVFIVIAGIALFIAVFAALPSLPPIPSEIESVGNTFIDGIGMSFNLLLYIFNPAVFMACFTVFFGVLFFEPIYNGIMWILRKIPVLGIK